MERRDKNLEELGARLRAETPTVLPIFPTNLASSIKKTLVWNIWAQVIATPEKSDELVGLMFLHPEARFHLFEADGCPRPAALRHAFDGGLIRTVETQGHWYEHPAYPDNYIRISPNTEQGWEKELLKSGQPLWRFEVVLTDVERRRRENHDTAQAIVAATALEKPNNAYAKIREHYNRHQAIYYGAGMILTIIGIAMAL